MTAALMSLVPLLLTGSPALRLDISLEPRAWTEKTRSELAISIANTSDTPVTLLMGNTANATLFFAIHLKDASGKDIWTGREQPMMDIDDLPVGLFQTIGPGSNHRATLDWRALYNLRPGQYSLSVIYRVQPEDKADVVRYYLGELSAHHVVTGVIESGSVSFVVEAKKQ
jgi:hypothetical protein